MRYIRGFTDFFVKTSQENILRVANVERAKNCEYLQLVGPFAACGYDVMCSLSASVVIFTLEIPSNERSLPEGTFILHGFLIQARQCSLQRPVFPHYYGIKRARI